MTQDRLAALIAKPEVQQKILSNYHGGYSLGLALNPNNRNEVVIRVRIEGEDPTVILPEIVLEGETIPIIVNTNFKVPEPLYRA